MKRRKNFKPLTVAGIILSVVLLLNVTCSSRPKKLDKIGLQLFTMGFQAMSDIEGVLASVKEAGYDQVEFAGYGNKTPEEIRAILDSLGLTSPAVHARNLFTDEGLAEAIDAAKIIGHKYLILPSLPRELPTGEAQQQGAPPVRPPAQGIDSARVRQVPQGGRQPGDTAGQPSPIFQRPPDPTYTVEQIKKFAAEFNRIGKVCKDAGLSFAFHNHQIEFKKVEDGGVLIDILLEETDPKLVSFEMDLGWAIAGGGDPLEYLDKYPGRFKLFHVKDITEENEPCVVGEGTIDFAAIFVKSKKAGVEYYFVEQDGAPEPVANITASAQYLKNLTF